MSEAASSETGIASDQAITEEMLLQEVCPKPAEVSWKGRGPRGLPVVSWKHLGLESLAPKWLPFPKPPPGEVGGWQDNDPLPHANVVVMTWTSAEWDALHYVFSNGLASLSSKPENIRWREKWYPYRRNFYRVYQNLWTERLIRAKRIADQGTPSLNRYSQRWGSFCLVTVGRKEVMLFKSDLHLNTDGEELPLRQLCTQILEESKPDLLLSVGTSGGVRQDDRLGDVIVSNSATFKLGKKFESAEFNGRILRSKWQPPKKLINHANKLLMRVRELPVEPPTTHYPKGSMLKPRDSRPRIKVVDSPVITTDSFEFGKTDDKLGKLGCCVEMDDALIAMTSQDTPYGFVRNVSDPVINSNLPLELQTAWAVTTYQGLGLYTSFNGAIATWAVIAGG